MNLMVNAMNYLVNLVSLVIIFQTFFVLFVLSVGTIIVMFGVRCAICCTSCIDTPSCPLL